jgi:hypothetical protein
LKFHFYIPSGYGYIFSADADETLVDAHAVLSPYSSQQKNKRDGFLSKLLKYNPRNVKVQLIS